MASVEIVWKRLYDLGKPLEGVADEPVSTSFLSKVFYYSVGRNAYWGSWSSTYPGDSAFEVDLALLKQRIEYQRVQGSTFTLKALPALALMAKSYDLLLFQTWGTAPFEKVPRSAIVGKTAFEIARSICKHEPRITTFMAPRGKSVLPILPFKIYHSLPQGAERSLGWHEQPARYELRSIMELVADVTIYLNES